MNDLAKPVSHPWRGFLRLSVRGMIIIVLVIGVWLGWLVRSARIQRESVAAISRNGGLVLYSWEWDNGTYVPGRKSTALKWLAERIGADYLGHVTAVTFRPRSTAPDSVIAEVGSFSGLCALNLNHTSVTDRSLAHLAALKNLSNLDLDSTHISDRALAHLSALDKLAVLNLRMTEITDSGLAHLGPLHKLTDLMLSGTRVTDRGLSYLEGLTNLSHLDLTGTQVTAAGVEKLQRALPNLKIFASASRFGRN